MGNTGFCPFRQNYLLLESVLWLKTSFVGFIDEISNRNIDLENKMICTDPVHIVCIAFSGAVRRNPRTKEATKEEVKEVIKQFLYNARDRNGGRKARNARPQVEAATEDTDEA